MSDKILTDSIDLIVTKDDFIELMDDNAKQLDRIAELEAENKRLRGYGSLEIDRLIAERDRALLLLSGLVHAPYIPGNEFIKHESLSATELFAARDKLKGGG